jgi:hypothetical protein
MNCKKEDAEVDILSSDQLSEKSGEITSENIFPEYDNTDLENLPKNVSCDKCNQYIKSISYSSKSLYWKLYDIYYKIRFSYDKFDENKFDKEWKKTIKYSVDVNKELLFDIIKSNDLANKILSNYIHFVQFKNTKIPRNFVNIIDLIKYEYVIFLSNTYFKFSNNSLLKYFRKYDICYLNYSEKNNIIDNAIFLNNFIDNINENNLYNFKCAINIDKSIKKIQFMDNSIFPNILYKKIHFSKEELFLPFEIYSIKNMEYKLKTFCQIAEKLGAKEIKIKYDNKINNSDSLNLGVEALSSNSSISTKNIKKEEDNIDLKFDYNNYHYNLNLNKNKLYEIINEENELFITKENFNSDIDLKFLIDARCINLINDYHTNIIINHVNSLERKISIKAKSFGLNIGINQDRNFSNSIDINVKFINIYDNPDCIDGSNIYCKKEGFIHLKNIIDISLKKIDVNDVNDVNDAKDAKDDTKIKDIYFKINNYLLSSLKYDNIQKKEITKLSEYTNLTDYYNDIMSNFTEREIKELYYLYFNKDMSYDNFVKFKGIIISGSKYLEIFNSPDKNKYLIEEESKTLFDKIFNNDLIIRLHFYSYQYHEILELKKHFSKLIEYELQCIIKEIQNDNNIEIENSHGFTFKKIVNSYDVYNIYNIVLSIIYDIYNPNFHKQIIDEYNSYIEELEKGYNENEDDTIKNYRINNEEINEDIMSEEEISEKYRLEEERIKTNKNKKIDDIFKEKINEELYRKNIDLSSNYYNLVKKIFNKLMNYMKEQNLFIYGRFDSSDYYIDSMKYFINNISNIYLEYIKIDKDLILQNRRVFVSTNNEITDIFYNNLENNKIYYTMNDLKKICNDKRAIFENMKGDTIVYNDKKKIYEVRYWSKEKRKIVMQENAKKFIINSIKNVGYFCINNYEFIFMLFIGVPIFMKS